MKKAFIGVVALLVALALAGCVSNNEPVNNEPVNNDAESTEEEVATWADSMAFISETSQTLSDYFTIDSDIQNQDGGILLYMSTKGGSNDVDVIMNYAVVIGLLVNESYADSLLESGEEIKLITITVDSEAWYIILSSSFGNTEPPFFSSLVVTDAFQQSNPDTAQKIQDAYNEILGNYDLFGYTDGAPSGH